MKNLKCSETIPIPNQVSVDIKSRVVTVTGPYGKLIQSFKHLHLDLKVIQEGRAVQAVMWFSVPLKQSCVRTVLSHISNMCKGVLKGYQFNMRMIYNHFPILANIKNNGRTIEIVNYLGNKAIRTVQMIPGVEVKKSDKVKDELILTGNDLYGVSQSAALIHQSAVPMDKDCRAFLDGIYVSAKGTMKDD